MLALQSPVSHEVPRTVRFITLSHASSRVFFRRRPRWRFGVVDQNVHLRRLRLPAISPQSAAIAERRTSSLQLGHRLVGSTCLRDDRTTFAPARQYAQSKAGPREPPVMTAFFAGEIEQIP